MTFKEKFLLDHPYCEDFQWEVDYGRCPAGYGYEERIPDECDRYAPDCKSCWDREMEHNVENEKIEISSHSKTETLRGCINLIGNAVSSFQEWLEFVADRNGIISLNDLDDEEKFQFSISYMDVVRMLFLSGTNHSGGTSTAEKCRVLGVDCGETVDFNFSEEDDE